MKFYLLKGITHHLEKNWSWQIYVFKDNAAFASCVIRSVHRFESRKACENDMKKTIKDLSLKELPKIRR